MDGQYRSGDIVLGNWALTRLIGEGSFGRVFEAERVDFGHTYRSAIKIITIPQSQSEVRSVMADGMDPESAKLYFRGIVAELVDEFTFMSDLKGNSNIASYEDHSVVQHSESSSGEGIGWDIIIRMELLTPLLDYAQSRELTQSDVMRIGIDMCKALEVCQMQNVIHRDVKPENIFVSKMGDFKLGDFGIARTVEKTTSGLSKKGTYSYMAPEVYLGGAYGSSVDIYSLGIVLYRLLNDNRTPFMPDYPTLITHNDREAALARRISGETISAPKNADAKLARIVLKACAYDPKDRHASPTELRKELEAAVSGKVAVNAGKAVSIKTPAKTDEQVDKWLASLTAFATHVEKQEASGADVHTGTGNDVTESINFEIDKDATEAINRETDGEVTESIQNVAISIDKSAGGKTIVTDSHQNRAQSRVKQQLPGSRKLKKAAHTDDVEPVKRMRLFSTFEIVLIATTGLIAVFCILLGIFGIFL